MSIRPYKMLLYLISITMYDEDGNLIIQDDLNLEDQNLDEQDWQDDWYVKLSKEEHESLLNKARRADVLKAKSAKYSQEKRNSPNNSEVIENLQKEINEIKNEKLSIQIKSLYADADVEKVNELIHKGLTVEQATKALYADEMMARTTNVWMAGRAGGGESISEEAKKSIAMASAMLWL
mgnify:FL=1